MRAFLLAAAAFGDAWGRCRGVCLWRRCGLLQAVSGCSPVVCCAEVVLPVARSRGSITGSSGASTGSSSPYTGTSSATSGSAPSTRSSSSSTGSGGARPVVLRSRLFVAGAGLRVNRLCVCWHAQHLVTPGVGVGECVVCAWGPVFLHGVLCCVGFADCAYSRGSSTGSNASRTCSSASTSSASSSASSRAASMSSSGASTSS